MTIEKELERLRAEWNSVVAHDLRQPLESISLGAQALARSTHDSLNTSQRSLPNELLNSITLACQLSQRGQRL